MTRVRPSFLVAFLLFLPVLAFAELGGDVGSVQRDRAQLNARLTVKQTARYAVHEMKSDSGAAVREFVSPEGRVFGVAWQGQFHPNYQQLLGAYFDRLAQANQQQQRKARRAPVMIEQSGFVFQTYGHLRSISGRAFVRDLVPQGVNLEEIK